MKKGKKSRKSRENQNDATPKEASKEKISKEKKITDPVKKKDKIRQKGRSWYVIHTYSGYEDQVADNLKQRVVSMGMDDKIFNVLVPTEKNIEMKGGKKKVTEKKVFPGYVLVEMIVTEDSWYVVRNTPNVTGFIGFGTRPTPMSQQEIKRLMKKMGQEEPRYKIDFKIGEQVKITDGPFKDFDGVVDEVDEQKGKIKVLVNMFGRETPVTLDFLQAKKI